MRFYINGNIENVKYCLIYRYDSGDVDFLWRNGKVGDFDCYNEKYNTVVYWWDLEENWNKKINIKNETLNDKIYKMMFNNYMSGDDWFITCFNECPNKLSKEEILKIINFCCNKKRSKKQMMFEVVIN